SNGYPDMLEQADSLFSATHDADPPSCLREAATNIRYPIAACGRLNSAGETLLIIDAGSVDPAGRGSNQLEILAAIAPPLGMVLERARAVTSLRLQTQRTQAVLDILAALGPAESIDLIAGPVANALRIMCGADHCTVNTIEGAVVTV